MLKFIILIRYYKYDIDIVSLAISILIYNKEVKDMTSLNYLKISDPGRFPFAKEKKFNLSPLQVSFIKEHNLVKALCSGMYLEVYKAFQRPENLALL